MSLPIIPIDESEIEKYLGSMSDHIFPKVIAILIYSYDTRLYVGIMFKDYVFRSYGEESFESFNIETVIRKSLPYVDDVIEHMVEFPKDFQSLGIVKECVLMSQKEIDNKDTRHEPIYTNEKFVNIKVVSCLQCVKYSKYEKCRNIVYPNSHYCIAHMSEDDKSYNHGNLKCNTCTRTGEYCGHHGCEKLDLDTLNYVETLRFERKFASFVESLGMGNFISLFPVLDNIDVNCEFFGKSLCKNIEWSNAYIRSLIVLIATGKWISPNVRSMHICKRCNEYTNNVYCSACIEIACHEYEILITSECEYCGGVDNCDKCEGLGIV